MECSASFRGLIPANVIDAIRKNILILAGCGLSLAVGASPALAQHPVGHPGVGGHAGGGVRMGVPPQAGISRPHFVSGPHFVGVGPRGFGFRQGSFRVFRQREFFGRRFARFGLGLGFNSLWWPTCAPSLGWGFGWGWECNPVPFYGYTFESYVGPQIYENPVYAYGGGDRDLIWLYMKDGTVYGVTDYWFVNGQLHFTAFDEGAPRGGERVVPADELDVQQTTFVNSRRGFRIVFRDEPWQQYLKDHPDVTPPDLPGSSKN